MRTKTLIVIILLGFHHNVAQNENVDYSNPVLIMGSSWGNVFQRLYINADYETMLKLTSSTSIKKFGRERIQRHYKSMEFGYQLKLKSWNLKNGHYEMNYVAKINATDIIFRLILEKGDTCKIVLPYNFLEQKIFLYK